MTFPSPREGDEDAAPADHLQGPLVPLVARYSGTTTYLCVMVTLIFLALLFDVRI